MCRADRAFRQLVILTVGLGVLLLLPLLITLFPGEFESALRGYDTLAQQCVAALFPPGAPQPPLGALTLALAGASITWGALRSFALLRRTRRALARQRPLPPPERLRTAAISVGVIADLVCIDSAFPQAFCAGLLRPRIFVSTGAAGRLKRRELEAVLWHERYHLRHRDPLRIFLAHAASSTLVALPLVRAFAERFEIAKELDADELAMQRQGGRSALASALVKMGRGSFGAGRLAVGAWSASHARVDQVCGHDPEPLLPRPSARARCLTGLALAAVLMLGLGQAARANLVPAATLEFLGLAAPASAINSCPLPYDGILL